MAASTLLPRSAADRPSWPLTGRHAELDSVVDSLRSDTGKAVLVTGAAGVGKSRLAREAMDRLATDGWTTTWVAAGPATRDTPLGAVSHLLPRDAVGDPGRVVEHVRSAVARKPRLVVAVDDVQLLDHTTVSLLGPLMASAPARLLVTVPEAALAPDPLGALWRSGGARVVELGRLDDLAVDTLLHRALGGPVAGATTLAFLDASDGNALYLREMVLGSLTAGALREVDGVWRLEGTPQMSGVLRSVVQARVDSLGPEVRAVLEDLAVGTGVDLADLLAEHEGGGVEAAERAGLLRVVSAQRRRRVTLAHGLHREVLREDMGTLAAVRLARRHAERLERSGLRRSDDRYRVALLRLDADGQAPADMLDAALELARSARDLDSLERLSRAWLLASGSPVAARALAEVLYERGRFVEADEVLGEAVARSAELADPDTLAALLVARATVLGYGLGRLDEAAELLAGPAAGAGASGPMAGRVRIRRVQLEAWRSGPTAALAVLDESPVGGVTPQDDPGAVSFSERGVRAVALALSGHPVEAVRWLSDGPVQVPEIPGPDQLAVVLGLTEGGRFAEAEAVAQQCWTATARAQLPLSQLWFAGALGRTNLLRGRPRLALWWHREQLGLARQLGQRLPAALAASGMMTAAAWLGDQAAMQDAATAWDGAGFDPLGPSMFPGDLARGPAWRLMREGDLETAHVLLAAAQDVAAAGGHVAQAAHAAYDRVRLGRPGDVAGPLADLAAHDDGALLAALARHAAAAAADDPDALELAAEQAAGLGMVLCAAEAASGAATSAARAGDPRRAAGLRRRSAAWAEQTEGARTPALLAGGTGEADRLTAREREIAVLVAQGRTSKEIAAALVLSVRTVDNHLQRVFAKLGVSSRAEVAAALGEERP
ncbi:MAG TPA: LuxR C-terminal-related transcriptional regulator [Actinomycetes bacterium]|nr:LuxR C-terminal-related transcriptional regulator [Actinomycetes bacterium]